MKKWFLNYFLKNVSRILFYQNYWELWTMLSLNQTKEIACIIIEPVLGSAGFIPAKMEYLKYLSEESKKRGYFIYRWQYFCSSRSSLILKILVCNKNWHIFALQFWAINSVGSECLPYKEEVGSSSLSSPTYISPHERGVFCI